MKKKSDKIQKKAKEYKVVRKKEEHHEKILTAEGYRRAMLKKLNMEK